MLMDLYFIHLFICGAENQTQCLTHARQVLYHWATTPTKLKGFSIPSFNKGYLKSNKIDQNIFVIFLSLRYKIPFIIGGNNLQIAWILWELSAFTYLYKQPKYQLILNNHLDL